ncbi:MAG: hypothetical protein IT378_02490 [Sandaracinaceae bacterium]|nr:hypothetical protein [Sandaracinaceae bacterium]
MPRIRWVIDENFLYAYRDYEIVADTEDPFAIEGDEDPNFLGQPVAAFAITSHFDIRREYDSVTGEERNVVVENTNDRHWYERQFMRVDWSVNLISGYFGAGYELTELFGQARREPASLFVQPNSEYPVNWRPQFHFMSCNGAADTECDADDRDYAGDYAQNQLYSMSFVTQEILSPGTIIDPFFGVYPYCGEASDGLPECASVAVWTRTSFLRVSDTREYVPVGWDHDRFNRAGYFAMDRPTYDRSHRAGDPSYGITDFTNQSANRHNIWREWYRHNADGSVMLDSNGRPIERPYAERTVRPIVWYTSSEVPAHLVRPGFELVGEWNQVFMSTVRALRGDAQPEFPDVQCQTTSPDEYCYCERDPQDENVILNPTCPGRYEVFETPDQAAARGVVNPFDCHVVVDTNGDGNAECRLEAGTAGQQPILRCDPTSNTEPDWANPAMANGATDASFNGWFAARMVGTECVNVLRTNTCNLGNRAEWDQLDCQERGDVRFKLLSYVDQPGTPFLGVAQMRGDPVTGEIITGDANIGGPAMNTQRTVALQAYDLMQGRISEREFYTGEDVRGYLEALDNIDLPAPPRIDFSAALRAGVNLDPTMTANIDRTMAAAMERAELLQGAEGRAAVFSDRLRRLAGTDLERRLLENVDTLVAAGYTNLPSDVSPEDMDEAILDQVSPFRVDMNDRLERMRDFNRRLGLMNMILPDQYTDNSVMNYVTTHMGYGRAQLEFELNRRLYRDTQVHEMGHCLGLRHNFGGTADVHNYFDGYYVIDERFPLPDPRAYEMRDGTPGMSPVEQREWEDDYDAANERRELAGIDQWMNASVMDYTPNWYQRINGAGRYDFMAISFGYGDIVDMYDNSTSRAIDEITPLNTPRVPVKYYHGGETCTTTTDCPFAVGGSREADLLPSNMAAGLTQQCVPNPRVAGRSVCSSFDDQAQALRESGMTRWVPVPYWFCEDIRASTRSAPACATFDEGDSFRQIVRSQAESYERDYIFAAFRRYRRNFSVGSYFSRLLRFVDPLLSIYQNLVYRYATDPEFRSTTGAFGFYDEFMATVDIFNHFSRMMSQPAVGAYQWNDGWKRYNLVSVDPDFADSQLSLRQGQGRYFNSIYQRGLTGIDRVERVGSIFDAILAIQLASIRQIGPFYGPDVVFSTNFYDIFPNEVQQVFTGMIAGRPEAYMPRVSCAPGSAFPDCTDPRITYMSFYRGDCSEGAAPGSCYPDPAEVTYRPDTAGRDGGMYVLNGGTSFLLQNYAAIYGLAEFPIYYDTTFQNQMFLCIEGSGDCNAPAQGATEGVDYVRYTSRRLGLNFLAFQVTPAEGVFTQTSIAFTMVKEARDTEFILRMLQTYRGDFESNPAAPSCLCYLTPQQQADLAALGYTIPSSEAQLQFEIERLNDRLVDLESFFNYLVQLERTFGISFPALYRRPEI